MSHPRRQRTVGAHALAVMSFLLIWVTGCRSPDWVRAFAYEPAGIVPIEIGDLGFPHVPVVVHGTCLLLPFDTGNMVGVSVSSRLFDELGLTADGSWTRLDSAGETVRSLRVAEDVEVSVLGRDLGPTRVYELDHPTLEGLVGPTVLSAGRFTLDYASRRMALSTAKAPERVAGFRQVPLVRSSRHPRLILIRGHVEGRSVLLELDTGKSRTVIHPQLAAQLALKRGPRGVAIQDLRIGVLSFPVPSAKEVDQTGIDPTLPEPILAGVGSDVLSRFVWTVDYDAGVLWVPDE